MITLFKKERYCNIDINKIMTYLLTVRSLHCLHIGNMSHRSIKKGLFPFKLHKMLVVRSRKKYVKCFVIYFNIVCQKYVT